MKVKGHIWINWLDLADYEFLCEHILAADFLTSLRLIINSSNYAFLFSIFYGYGGKGEIVYS